MAYQVVSYWRKYVREVLVNRLGGLSPPRKSVVRLTDRPDMTLDVYCGRKTTMQQQQTAFHQSFDIPCLKPGRVAQSVGHLTRKSGVLGSIPGLATYIVSPSAFSRRAVVSYWRKYVHEVLINRL